MIDDRNNNNTLIGLAPFFGIGMLAWFFADLLDSKSGERVAAFGGVLGGIVGAAGAIFAVYQPVLRRRASQNYHPRQDRERLRSPWRRAASQRIRALIRKVR